MTRIRISRMAAIGAAFLVAAATLVPDNAEARRSNWWVPGAIIGGLIIGVGEKLSEVYLGPFVGGGIEIWFAYVLALVFLLFRPQGLFGEKIIDRV